MTPPPASPARSYRFAMGFLCLLVTGSGLWMGLRENSGISNPGDGKLGWSGPSEMTGAVPDPKWRPSPLPEATSAQPGTGELPQQGEEGSLEDGIAAARHRVVVLDVESAGLPQNLGASHFAANPGQDITARFLTGGGVKFQSGKAGREWQGTLRFSGTAGTWQETGTRLDRAAGNGITEWYQNRAEGIEHGFTLATRPSSAGTGSATLSLELEGLRAEADPEHADDLRFIDPVTGAAVLGYQKLVVRDAGGRELPSRMEPTTQGLQLTWQDAGAVYPVTVDPIVVSFEQAVDDAAGAAHDNLGLHAALDGDTAVVGGLNDDTPGGVNAGSVLIFRRTGTAWNLEAKLVDDLGAANDRFGVSVGISGDTVIVGSDFDDEASQVDCGSVSIFVRSGTTWARQGAKLVPAAAGANAGRAVAIDGNTAIVGGPNASSSSGRVWIYVRSGTAWAVQTTLQSAIPQNNANFGFAVDVQGNRVIIGEPRRSGFLTPSTTNPNHGQAVIYQRAAGGTTWAREVAFSPSDLQTGEQFGFAVAIHGNMAVIGGPGTPSGWTGASPAHATSRGRAFYARYSGSWPSSPVALPSPVLTDGAYFGFAVDVQEDLVAIAALGMDGNRGRVYLNSYRAGGTWAGHPSLQPPGLAATAWFGTGVSISGNRVLAGAHGGGTTNAGRAFIFTVDPVEDASINVTAVSGLAVNTPFPEELVAIRSVPGKEGFRLSLSGSLQRWDSLDVPLPVPAPADGVYFPATFNVKYQATIHNETDNLNVPLVDNGTVNQSVTASAFTLSGTVRNAVNLPVSRTLTLVPQVPDTILPNKTYRLTVTLSHMDGATEVVDVTRTLTGQKLISLSGSLVFGSIGTSLIHVTGNPAAGSVVQTTPLHFRISLTIPAGGAHVTGSPQFNFGGGPLTVRYTMSGANQGNLSLDGPQTVQVLGPNPGSSAGVRWSRGPVLLTQSGAQAQNFRVYLPAGFGYANYTADPITRRMKGSALVNVPLNSQFEPLGTVSIAGVSGLTLLSHERLPAFLVVASLTWDIAAGTFTGIPAGTAGNVAGVHFGGTEANALYAAANANPLVDGDDGTRMTNDGYFGRAGMTGQNLVVRASPEGRALLDFTCRAAQQGFKAHFPRGLTVPPGQTVITFQNSQVVSGTMTQSAATAATLTYATAAATTPACATTDPAQNQRTISFTNPGNVWQVTADGGLRAEGSIAAADIGWGIRPGSPAGLMVHTLNNVTTGVMHLAGTALSTSVYGNVPNDGAGYLPAAMLLTGHGSPSNAALVERPFRKGYDPAKATTALEFIQTGSADYPGFNIRAGTDGGLRAVSRLCNSTVGAYGLKAHSKYYLRRNGVTGVHDAITSELNLPAGLFYGYNMSMDGLRLAYEDNENVGSKVAGSMETMGPTQLSLSFRELLFSATGQLRNADLANPGPKTLAYWNTGIEVHAMEFAAVNECNMAAAPLLALSVTGQIPAITDAPLQARLGIHPDGNLASASSSGDSGIDSRFILPQTLLLKGPGGGTYTLNTVTKAALNDFATAPPGGIGFVSFAGALGVPFFEDIPVHVHATASAAGTPASELHLMAGGSYFSDPGFDSNNRGFPGPDLQAYRNGTDPQYLPVAKRNWRGVAALDYPLKWQPLLRQFASPAGMDDVDELLVLEVNHQVQKLTTEGVAITFGAGFETPQLSVAALAAEALTSGLKNALPDPDAMLNGIDGLETLLTDRLEKAIGGVLEGRLNTLADAIVSDLNAAYDSADDAGEDWTGFSGLNVNFTNRGAIESAISTLAQPGTAGGPSGVIDQIDNALAKAEQACGLALTLVGQKNNRVSIISAVTALSGNLPSGPINGVGAEIMDQAEDGLQQAQLILTEAKSRLSSLREGTQKAQILARLGTTFQQAASGAATTAVNRLIETYRNEHDVTGRFWTEYSPAQHKARVLAILRQSISGSTLAASVQPVLRGVLTEVRTQFRGALDLVFSEINRLLNRAVKGLVDQLVEAGTTEFKAMAGSNGDADSIASGAASVGNFCAAARIDGYAQINGEEIEEIRLNARLKFNLAASLSVDGWFHLKNLNGAPASMSCRPAGVVATEVKIGASAAADFGPVFKVKVTLEGIFSFAAPGAGGAFPLAGLDGSFDLRSAMAVKQASITHMAAKFGFGSGVGFVSGQIEGTVYAFGANGRCFFGTTNNGQDFSLIDPQTQAVLNITPQPSLAGVPLPRAPCLAENLTGFYTALDLDVSLNTIFGIPDTCFLRVTGHVGVGNYCFYQNRGANGKYLIPGVRYRFGVSGEVVCVLELSAIAAISAAVQIPITNLGNALKDPAAFLGDLSNSTARGVGDIEFKASIGLGPFSIPFSHTLRMIMQLSKEEVDVDFE